eukprot:SAG22_NODE_4872_length_1145_cov_1.198853_2_plen_237_part_01
MLTSCGMVRTTDPKYLSCVEGWYTALAAQLEGYYHKDGGPIKITQVSSKPLPSLVLPLARIVRSKTVPFLARRSTTRRRTGSFCSSCGRWCVACLSPPGRQPWTPALPVSCPLIGVPVWRPGETTQGLKHGIAPTFYSKTGWPAPGPGYPADYPMLPYFGGYADIFWTWDMAPQPSSGQYEFAGDKQGNNPSDVPAGYPYLGVEIGGGMAAAYNHRTHMFSEDMPSMHLVDVADSFN